MRKIDLGNFKVARSETARHINRRIVLNLIREQQPISRAGLARRSGLQRSTVSAIAEQLISERWVVEGATGQLPRGRRPTFLHLNSERAGIIGVDIQVTTTTLAVASVDSRFVAQESMPTGTDPAGFLTRLSRRIKDLMRAHPKDAYEGIGVSLPGRLDLATQRLVFAPNLGWRNLDLRTPLERATGLPVELENAANTCALAESWSGRHADNARYLVAVTVAEGVGVGMILNGQLVRGPTGLAGEFGHVTLFPDGPLCHCGNQGCWETMASNAAAVRFYTESGTIRKGEVGSKSAMATLGYGDLLRLVDQGDERAVHAVEKAAQYLGQGIAMLITGLAPDAVVVVGEVTRIWNRVGPIVEREFKAHSPTHAPTRVLPTNPETQPRLRGTIALVLQKHFGSGYAG